MNRVVMMLVVAALASPMATAVEPRHISPVRPTPGNGNQDDATKPAQKKIEYHGVAIVNRVEPVLGLLNITHGDVPVAGWATYTRDIRVKPRELVQGLVPGMTIRFQVTAVDPLTWVITALEPIK